MRDSRTVQAETALSRDRRGARSSPELPALLTVDEVADVFRVSPRTVRTWLANGSLPSSKVGGVRRIPSAEVAIFFRTGAARGGIEQRS